MLGFERNSKGFIHKPRYRIIPHHNHKGEFFIFDRQNHNIIVNRLTRKEVEDYYHNNGLHWK